MATKKKYQIKRDGFNDGVERAFDDVIELADGAAAPLVALGAVVPTDLPLTDVVVPTDAELAAAQQKKDAEALAAATAKAKSLPVKAAPAKPASKKK